MALLDRLKHAVRTHSLLHRYMYQPYMVARFHLPTTFRKEWVQRIDDVLTCPDAALIPRVADAGTIRAGYQVMHNGLKVVKGSYYAYPITRMLSLSRGVHEPQEEKAFGEVLEHIPDGGVMIELGAYWGFYSMWFQQRVRGAKCHLIEPDPINLNYGRRNFELNKMVGTFTQGYVGDGPGTASDGIRLISVDDYCAREGIAFIDILHADIQGAERDMLTGARKMLDNNSIGHLFVSSHSDELHAQCLGHLRNRGLMVLADVSPSQSYSVDGLIIARNPKVNGPDSISVSAKPSTRRQS